MDCPYCKAKDVCDPRWGIGRNPFGPFTCPRCDHTFAVTWDEYPDCEGYFYPDIDWTLSDLKQSP